MEQKTKHAQLCEQTPYSSMGLRKSLCSPRGELGLRSRWDTSSASCQETGLLALAVLR